MDNHRKEIEKILDYIPTHDYMVKSISLDLYTRQYCTQALAYALIAAAEILAEALNDDG